MSLSTLIFDDWFFATKMSYKKLVVILLCVLYGCLLTIALINIVVDPFYIFRTPFLRTQTQINDRYAKIEYLKNNRGKFNSYLMGSSRLLLTPPNMIEKYISMGKCYNLAIIGATVNEHLLHIKYFIKNGYPVKTLYIDLDIDFMFTVKTHREQDSLLRLHPDVSNTSPIEFYWSYLSILPKGDIRRKLKANFGKKTRPAAQFGNDGAMPVESDVNNGPIFFEDQRVPGNYLIRNKTGKENLALLREIVALCKQHDIHLILFTTPHHKSIMDHFAEEDYISFLRDLSEVAAFWNFSGYNSITTDNKNYFDHSHYKPAVSRLIAARIFNDTTVIVPKDFGALVTQENVDSYLEKVRIIFEKK